jgi:ABC-2 type transport system ATP-binding protein
MVKIVADHLNIEFPVNIGGSRSLRDAFTNTISRVGGRVIANKSNTVVCALEDISFSLNRGDRLGLIGANGSGKTTLIRTLAGVYEPSRGRLDVEGVRVPMFDIGLGFDDEGNGYENIYIRGLIMGLTREQIAAKMPEIAEFSELGGYLDLPVRTYSAGMSLRLMFAIATSLEGDIILMDEWLAVGDAEFRHKANARLRKLTEGAGILVLASHDMSLLRETCTLGMHIEAGKVRNFGKIGDVIADSERPAG